MTNAAIHKPSILVVDDTSENIDVLKETLKNDYVVRPALNGVLALKIAAADPRPDLILLDIMMPVMDGYEVMRRLRADETTREIPVIFVTAISEMEGELKGLELGAVDYLTKPINPPIVKARVHTHIALHEARVQLKQQNQVLLNERKLVEDIITRMRAAKSFDNRFLRYLISPVDRTNGDILLSAFTPDGQQWVLVGYFTGHGLPAAVAAPLISHVFYTRLQEGNSIEATLEEINAVLHQQLPANIFMVGCMVEISASRNKIKLWNAGMPQCVLMQEGEVKARIASRSTPLGITAQIDVQDSHESFDVQEGSRLYIFSDGVSEVDNAKGELFGYSRVEDFLAGMVTGSKIPEELLMLLGEYHGNTNFTDDITLVEVRV